MKKVALMIAAAAAICTAVPASAETVVIKEGGMHRHHEGWHRDRAYRAHAEWRHHDRGYHRGWERGERRGGAAVLITR